MTLAQIHHATRSPTDARQKRAMPRGVLASLSAGVCRPAVIAAATLATVLAAGCSRPDIAVVDATVKQGIIRHSEDHFAPLPGFSGMWASDELVGAAAAGASAGPYADPTRQKVRAAGVNVGDLMEEDGGAGSESFVVRGANAQILVALNQVEVRSLMKTDEDLQGSYKGEAVVEISEAEGGFKSGGDVETIRWRRGATNPSVARTTEFGALNFESLRQGMKIEFQHNGASHVLDSKVKSFGMLMPLGSTIALNGRPLYSVDTIVAKKAALNFFQGFSLKADGKEFARLDVVANPAVREDGYAVSVGPKKVGSIFLDQTKESQGEHGPTHVKNTLYIVLEGETPAEKLANLEQIDLVLALMPDQVNLGQYNLDDMEKLIDVLRVGLSAGKTLTPDEARLLVTALATEEDPTTIPLAIRALVPGGAARLDGTRAGS